MLRICFIPSVRVFVVSLDRAGVLLVGNKITFAPRSCRIPWSSLACSVTTSTVGPDLEARFQGFFPHLRTPLLAWASDRNERLPDEKTPPFRSWAIGALEPGLTTSKGPETRSENMNYFVLVNVNWLVLRIAKGAAVVEACCHHLSSVSCFL